MLTTSQAPTEIRGNRLYVGGELQIARPEAVGTGLALYRTRNCWDGSWRDGILVIPEDMARLIIRVDRAMVVVEREAAKLALVAAA